MASDELVHLIDLSLGVQPQGVVNFNYLHGLLHEIVRRLMVVENFPSAQLDQVKRTQQGRKGVSKHGVSKSETEGFDGSGSGGSGDDDEDGGGQPSTPELPGTASLKQMSSYTKSRQGRVTAANDLGALERKLHDLEQRVNTMESLPDMLARMATDSKATPVSDMWNFTTLDKRLTATEEGLGKVLTCYRDIINRGGSP